MDATADGASSVYPEAGADGASAQLAAIPGQDPTAVTASGPPITVLTGPAAFIAPRGSNIGATALAVDGLGNIIIADAFPSGAGSGTLTVTKLDGQLTQVWTESLNAIELFPSGSNNQNVYFSLAADASGNIYIGGQITMDGGVNRFAAVEQLLPNGTQGWTQTTGPTNRTSYVTGVTVGSDGTIYAVGGSQGQLPNQPASASGHGFALHYSSSGTPLLVVQSSALDGATAPAVDSSGNTVVMGGTSITKVDATFTSLWTAKTATGSTALTVLNVAAQPNGGGVFDFESPTNASLARLVGRDPSTGNATWTRALATQTATIDTVEGETWKGQFMNGGDAINGVPPMMVATDDAIYLAGQYDNTYAHGSSPPPSTTPCFVARLDLTGNQVWFRQFRYAPAGGSPPASDFPPTGMAINGSKLVVSGAGVVFQLNAADGSGP